MLISFKIENFLSFNQKQEFSMLTGQSQKLSSHIRKLDKNDTGVLKTAVIYGANASGKSNFIRAVDFARQLIINGIDKNTFYNKHFRLETNKLHEVSTFEFEIKIDSVIYAYGFDILLKTKRVVEEWLYKVGKTSDKAVFVRQTMEDDSIKIDFNINFSKKENQLRVQYIGIDTLPNQLFLTEINHRNVKSIKEITPLMNVFDWFEDILTIVYPESKYRGIELVGNNELLSQGFCNFLKLFDTGIHGIETKSENIEKMLNAFPEEIRQELRRGLDDMEIKERRGLVIGDDFFNLYKDADNQVKVSRLMTKHKNSEGEDVLFDIGDESDGTQRMFDFIPALIALATTNKVFLIDELDRSLHPLLSKKIIELFLNHSSKTKSQLLVTTHEASLLNLKFLRRDEMWFVEKNKKGETILYSLEQFKPRHDKEIRKGYLYGRFGGIPDLGNVKELSWL